MQQVIKIVFTKSLLSFVLFLSGCGSMITKPIGLATKAVVTPVKVVSRAAVDVVGKRLGAAVRVVKPLTPGVRIR